MQEKSDSFKEFSDRFSALSVRFGLSTVQTCKKIGVSRSLFYEIRDGSREPTGKMWQRLKSAEQEAGLSLSHIVDAEERQATGEPITAEEKRLIEETKHALDPIIRNIVSGLMNLPNLSELEQMARKSKRWPLSDEDRLKPIDVLIKELGP